jgi:hypothetical protein
LPSLAYIGANSIGIGPLAAKKNLVNGAINQSAQ